MSQEPVYRRLSFVSHVLVIFCELKVVESRLAWTQGLSALLLCPYLYCIWFVALQPVPDVCVWPREVDKIQNDATVRVYRNYIF